MTARSQAFMEAWDMKKQKVTFEQLMTKINDDLGLPEKWQRQTKLETARNFKNLGVAVETISQATGLAPADIAAL
jgi:hypothetical protein